MKKELDKILNSGCSIKEILAAAGQLKKDEQIRCNGCNRRLGDIDDGILIIKCKCGEYHNYII